MGTLRDEMSKVLNEWDKQDQQVETTSQPSQEKTMEKRVTATQKLINIIAANPGATSKASSPVSFSATFSAVMYSL